MSTRPLRNAVGGAALVVALVACLAAPAIALGSPYSDAVAGTGGVTAYWRLGEASGSVAADAKGSNSGTYTGGVVHGVAGAIAGDADKATAFDGSSGYVNVPTGSAMRFGDSFSAEAWVKRAAISTPGNQVVVSKQNGSWVLMFDPSNRLVLRRSNVGDVVASSSTVTDTTAWHHVVATKNGSAVHLYLDGRDVTGTVASETMVDNTLPLAIGQSSGTAYFNGGIDEVALYSGALPPATVTQHYLIGHPAPSGGGTSGGPDPVIAAAGDISCSPFNSNYNLGAGVPSACRQRSTSDLLVGAGLAAVLPLGDTQYDNGSLSEFQGAYDPTWGRVKSITKPAVGNHEYNVGGAAGYFDYFDGVGAVSGAAGDRGKGYYSFDVGAWHLVALNSECSQVGGCQTGSAQERWLKADLAAHPAKCTLAYWHRPLFNSSFTGSDTEVMPLWQDLYNAGAEVVLNGHAHDYERFAPQTPSGGLDAARGVRQFVVGTGGEDRHSIPSAVAHSEVHDTATFGILKLTLHPAGYDWRFVPAAGGSFVDAGTAVCH
jgi:hypothetical protein